MPRKYTRRVQSVNPTIIEGEGDIMDVKANGPTIDKGEPSTLNFTQADPVVEDLEEEKAPRPIPDPAMDAYEFGGRVKKLREPLLRSWAIMAARKSPVRTHPQSYWENLFTELMTPG